MLTRRLAVALTLAVAVLGVAGAAFAGATGTERQLAQIRAATARFHQVDLAVAAGYQPVGACTESPDGVMGVHYLNPALLGDGVVDPARPELLLYVPGPDGPVLAGVEYMTVDADQDLGTDADRPALFDVVPFDGPMAGHEPGMPVHYDLHVWVWKHNPAGMYAPWNPALSC